MLPLPGGTLLLITWRMSGTALQVSSPGVTASQAGGGGGEQSMPFLYMVLRPHICWRQC